MGNTGSGSRIGHVLLLAAAAGAALAIQPPATPPPGASASANVVVVPEVDRGATSLEARARAQERALESSTVVRDFRFTNRLAESGITFRHRAVEDATRRYIAVHYDHGNGLVAADVDGDGHLDLFFTNQLGGNALYLGDGAGKFRDATARAGVAMAAKISVSASFADVDNDGDPDLYVTTVNQGNAFFLNEGKGRFRDATASFGLEHTAHSSAPVFFDFDNDGWLDLFLADVGRYTSGEQGPGGYFLGLEDAFHGHLHEERAEPKVLYRNEQGKRFRDVTGETGLDDRSWSGDTLFADLDGDRFPSSTSSTCRATTTTGTTRAARPSSSGEPKSSRALRGAPWAAPSSTTTTMAGST